MSSGKPFIEKDFIGKIFDKLTIIEFLPIKKHKRKVRCVCSCGKETNTVLSAIVNGKSRSCGCLNRETIKQNRLNKTMPGELGFNILYTRYSKSNKYRKNDKLKFELTKEEFRSLIKQNCHYCNSSPKQIARHCSSIEKRTRSEFLYNGLDRIDSSRGYSLDNVVPCCKQCNYSKRGSTYNEFMDWIRRLTNFTIQKDLNETQRQASRTQDANDS